jgi:hypothetical protein
VAVVGGDVVAGADVTVVGEAARATVVGAGPAVTGLAPTRRAAWLGTVVEGVTAAVVVGDTPDTGGAATAPVGSGVASASAGRAGRCAGWLAGTTGPSAGSARRGTQGAPRTLRVVATR